MDKIEVNELKKIISETIVSTLRSMNENKRLDGMARVGFLDNKARFEVYVRTDDIGFIPHVHIWDSATNGEDFDCCVKLETNEYFPHGHHIDKMNSEMCKAFNEFMRQPCRSTHYRNNYELAVDMWNINNSSAYVQIKEDEEGNTIIPNYDTIL